MSDIQEKPKTLSEITGYSKEELTVMQATVAKGTTNVEFMHFMNVAKGYNLNPFKKEIWCYKDNRGNLTIFAGRDGFLAIAQSNEKFNGIRSSEVRKNDNFSLDIANNKITHELRVSETRGEIVGAYAIVFRKDGEPTIEWVEMATYNKGYNTWKTHPAEMIKKVAETHALKKAFGVSGITAGFEYSEQNPIAANTIEIDPTKD